MVQEALSLTQWASLMPSVARQPAPTHTAPPPYSETDASAQASCLTHCPASQDWHNYPEAITWIFILLLLFLFTPQAVKCDMGSCFLWRLPQLCQLQNLKTGSCMLLYSSFYSMFDKLIIFSDTVNVLLILWLASWCISTTTLCHAPLWDSRVGILIHVNAVCFLIVGLPFYVQCLEENSTFK